MSISTSKRILLWLVSGGISVGIVSWIFYPDTFVRTPSTIHRLAFATLACVSFIVGIGILELVLVLIEKITAKRIRRLRSPEMTSVLARTSTSSARSVSTSPSRADISKSEATLDEAGQDQVAMPRKESNELILPIPESGQRLSIYAIAALALLVLTVLAGWSIRQLTRPSLTTAESNVNIIPGSDRQQAAEAELRKAIERKPAELRPALNAYQKISEDVHQVLSGRLEDQNIGGAIAVAVTNWQWNRENQVFKSPAQLGFQRVSESDALVNQVLRGEARIKDIAISRASEKRYLVTIHVVNLTRDFLKCRIDKGQLVEVKDAKNVLANNQTQTAGGTQIPQTVAASDEKRHQDGIYVIPPSEEGTVEFIAYCVNEDLAAPNGAANLAIYTLRDTEFSRPAELHANMKRQNSM